MPIEMGAYCKKLLEEAEEIKNNKEIMEAINHTPTNTGENITLEEWVNGSEGFYNGNKHVFEGKFPDE